MIDFVMFSYTPDLAVVPVMVQIGPMLIALLSAVVAALVGALVKLLKPSTMKTGLRIMWRNKLATVVLVVAVVGVSQGVSYLKRVVADRRGGGTAVVGAGDWAFFRGGAARRGATLDADDPTTPARLWGDTTAIKTLYSSPAVVGNRVFASTADKGIYADRGGIVCLDADSGDVIWDYSPRGFRATYSSPSVQSNYLVCGEGLHFTEDARITCLRVDFEANDYELLWELRTKSHVESSPCIYKGRAYVGAGEDGLYCIELAPGPDHTPVVTWHIAGSKSESGDVLDGEQKLVDCEAPPAAHDGKVFFCLGMGGKAVICVDADTGRKLWKVDTPYPVFGAPTVVDGKVIVGMGTGNMIQSAELAREAELKKLRDKGLDDDALAEEAKRLGPAGEVWCMDADSGDVLWSRAFERTILGAVAAADGRLYFGSRDHHLYSLDLDGKGLKSFDSHEPIVTSPAVGREHVYFVTETGVLHCLDKARLTPAWNMRIGSAGNSISSPVVSRGHVYVGTIGNGLVCLGGAAVDEEYLWAGPLGGEGASGWVDGSPIPGKAKLAWRYPKSGASEADGPLTVITTPVACSTNALYAGISGARTGLVKLVLTGNRRKPYREAWFCAATNPPALSAAILGDRVYFISGRPGDGARRLYTVDDVSGAVLAERAVADDAGGQMLLTRDELLVADRTEGLTLLREEGDSVTSVVLDVGRVVGSPVSANDMFFVAGESSVSALSATGGETLWRVALSSPARAGVVVGNGIVAVGTAEGVVGLSVLDGAEVWSTMCGEAAGSLVCNDDGVACVTTDGEVVLMDWAGRERARAEGVVPGLTPVLCGDIMMCLKADGIELVDIASGETRRWGGRLGWLGGIVTPAVVLDSKVYFGTKDRGLVCIAGK